MSLTAIRKMDLSIHGKNLSVIEALLADGAVTELKIAANTITNASIAQTATIADAALATISTAGKVLNSATSASASNVADAIVTRDALGGFSAGSISVTEIASSGNLSAADISASGDLSVAGDASVTGALSADGNATLGADLMVAGDSSLSGTLAVDGDLSVNTNKFSVAAATGNTIVGGTLAVDGDATMSGNLLASGDVTIQGNLAVNGTTTSVNSVDLVVNDRLVHLNEPATAGADDPVPTGLSGLSVHRGSAAGVEREHAGLVWEESAQKFVMQMLDQDAAGSTKLNLEIKNLQAREGNFQINANGINTEIRLENNLVRFDLDDGADATWVDISNDTFHVERTNDTYNTYSQFDINHDGVELKDENGDAMLPTLDQHLVVKKYVDDASTAMQGNVDLKFDKAGGPIDVDGTVELSITDGGSAVLGGQTLAFAGDHVNGVSSDVNASTTFGIDQVEMSWAVDTGETYSTMLSSGTLNLTYNDGADASSLFNAANDILSAMQVAGGNVGELVLNADMAVLRAGEDGADSIVLQVEKTGAKLVSRDSSQVDSVWLPTADDHLVVKKYVDDKIADLVDSAPALLDTLNELAAAINDDPSFATTVLNAISAEETRAEAVEDEILSKSGIVIGQQNTYSATNVVANGDSLIAAVGKLDESLADIAGKTYYEAFIYGAAGGETSLAKPSGAPAIPDSAFTEVYIDGRKVFRGADRQFTVAGDGGSISFTALAEGQTVELRYFA